VDTVRCFLGVISRQSRHGPGQSRIMTSRMGIFDEEGGWKCG
jgi:hypothetical protein